MIYKLFNPIEFSVDWGLLFGLISILSLVFAWVIKTFRDSSKDISVKEAFIEKLLNKPNELQNELRIILNGIEIEQLNKISLYLKNTGSSTLNSKDFYILPRIDLSGFTNIISLNISSSNEFTRCKTFEIEPSIVEFRLEDWESKDFIRVEILFESLSSEFESSLEYRIKEQEKEVMDLKEFRIDKHFGIAKDYNALITFPMFAAAFVCGLSYFIVKYGLRIDLSDLSSFGIGWKILFFIPTALTAIYVTHKWNNIIKEFHFTHLQIDQWYSMTLEEKLKK